MQQLIQGITTVIPTYNRCGMLRRAIRSARAQVVSGCIHEILVVDNASSDATCEMVAVEMQEDGRIRYQRHDKTVPAVQNFSCALRHVRTTHFSFLSDDDILLPGFYARYCLGFMSERGVAMYIGMTFLCLPDGTILNANTKALRRGVHAPAGCTELFKGQPPCWTGIIMDTKVVYSCGGIDPLSRANIDYDLEIRLAVAGKVIIDHFPCAVFFAYNGSASSVLGMRMFWPAYNWTKRWLANNGRPMLARYINRRTVAILSLCAVHEMLARKKVGGGASLRVLGRMVPGRGMVQKIKIAALLLNQVLGYVPRWIATRVVRLQLRWQFSGLVRKTLADLEGRQVSL